MSTKVLIVDDDEADRYILRRQLNSTTPGLVFSEAENGADALELLRKQVEQSQESELPDVIFLDINMPKLNGFGFLAEFERLASEVEALSSCVVLMISSSTLVEEKERALEYGFVKEFIVKGEKSSEELGQLVTSLSTA